MRAKDLKKLLTFALVWSMAFYHGEAQQTEPKPSQPIMMLRYLEDYRLLADSTQHIDFFDPVKYVSLSKTDPDFYASIGGDVRFLYEWVNNRFEGQTSDDGYLLSRFMLHTDVRLGKNFRMFGQLGSTQENGRQLGPRPIDEDNAFIHQLFADIKINFTVQGNIVLRIGRQETVLGASRLITMREGPNTRLSFDGIRTLINWSKWDINLLYLRPVNNRRGPFDNRIFENGRDLFGLYANKTVRTNFTYDLFFLGYNNENARFHQGSGDENRYILGARFFGNKGNFDYDIEGGYQFGTFDQDAGKGNIKAYGGGFNAGYTFQQLFCTPRIGLKADYISGDRDSDDLDLNTVNVLFPRQGYFRGAAAFAAANLASVHPELILKPAKDMQLVLDWSWYWRPSTADGTYAPNGLPNNPLSIGNENYLGSQANTEFFWKVNRNISVLATYAHFFGRGAIEQNPSPSEVADFLNVSIAYKF
ncbi:hypothetical protein FGF1_42810 [Flavobacteriaceae bacterium GF1]